MIKSRYLFLGITLFLVTSLPILLFLIVNKYNLNTLDLGLISIPRLTVTRYSEVSTLFHDNLFLGLANNLSALIKLFITQNDGLIFNSIPTFGTIYFISLPLLIMGLHVDYKDLKNNFLQFNPKFFMFIWFGVAVILGTITDLNINRINIIFILSLYFVAQGVGYILEHRRKVGHVVIIGYLILFSSFLHAYFINFPRQISGPFFSGLGEAIQYANTIPYEQTYISDGINMPYIYVLFYDKINPYTFLKSVNYENPQAPFRKVISFDKFHFGIGDQLKNNIYILSNDEMRLFKIVNYTTKKFDGYTVLIPNTSTAHGINSNAKRAK